MDINNFTRLSDDPKAVEYNIDNSHKISDYVLANFKNNGDVQKVKDLSLEKPQMFYKNGVGHLSEESKESILKRANNLTNLNRIHQLTPRMHSTIPLMSRGGCDTDIENKLKFIENTKKDKKKTSYLIDRFVPQVEKVKKMQNSIHIIPEDTDSGWRRGGVSSRLIVKDEDRAKRCGE